MPYNGVNTVGSQTWVDCIINFLITYAKEGVIKEVMFYLAFVCLLALTIDQILIKILPEIYL